MSYTPTGPAVSFESFVLNWASSKVDDAKQKKSIIDIPLHPWQIMKDFINNEVRLEREKAIVAKQREHELADRLEERLQHEKGRGQKRVRIVLEPQRKNNVINSTDGWISSLRTSLSAPSLFDAANNLFRVPAEDSKPEHGNHVASLLAACMAKMTKRTQDYQPPSVSPVSIAGYFSAKLLFEGHPPKECIESAGLFMNASISDVELIFKGLFSKKHFPTVDALNDAQNTISSDHARHHFAANPMFFLFNASVKDHHISIRNSEPFCRLWRLSLFHLLQKCKSLQSLLTAKDLLSEMEDDIFSLFDVSSLISWCEGVELWISDAIKRLKYFTTQCSSENLNSVQFASSCIEAFIWTYFGENQWDKAISAIVSFFHGVPKTGDPRVIVISSMKRDIETTVEDVMSAMTATMKTVVRFREKGKLSDNTPFSFALEDMGLMTFPTLRNEELRAHAFYRDRAMLPNTPLGSAASNLQLFSDASAVSKDFHDVVSSLIDHSIEQRRDERSAIRSGDAALMGSDSDSDKQGRSMTSARSLKSMSRSSSSVLLTKASVSATKRKSVANISDGRVSSDTSHGSARYAILRQANAARRIKLMLRDHVRGFGERGSRGAHQQHSYYQYNLAHWTESTYQPASVKQSSKKETGEDAVRKAAAKELARSVRPDSPFQVTLSSESENVTASSVSSSRTGSIKSDSNIANERRRSSAATDRRSSVGLHRSLSTASMLAEPGGSNMLGDIIGGANTTGGLQSIVATDMFFCNATPPEAEDSFSHWKSVHNDVYNSDDETCSRVVTKRWHESLVRLYFGPTRDGVSYCFYPNRRLPLTASVFAKEDTLKITLKTKDSHKQRHVVGTPLKEEHWLSLFGVVFDLTSGPVYDNIGASSERDSASGRLLYYQLVLIPSLSGRDVTGFLFNRLSTVDGFDFGCLRVSPKDHLEVKRALLGIFALLLHDFTVVGLLQGGENVWNEYMYSSK